MSEILSNNTLAFQGETPVVPAANAVIEHKIACLLRAFPISRESRRVQNLFNALSGNAVPGVRPTFAAMLRMLPCDLSHVDLTPGYEQAQSAEEEQLLRDLELTWEPTPEQGRAAAFPGPIGELHQSNNGRKWERAKAIQTRATEEALSRDVVTMTDTLGRQPLAVAVHELFKLAFGVEGKEETCFSPFNDSDIDDIPANLAALRVMRVAVEELERLCALDIANQREWLRERMEMINEVAPEAA